MAGESHEAASTPTGAVFLSYASQDAEAAQKICDALRATGIEIWFDKSELRLRDPALQRMWVSWRLDPLRTQPALQELERRMDWPP